MEHSVYFVSLGCDKNLVDSEVMLGILKDRGYFFTEDCNSADVFVINTCCFIGDAKEESIGAILEAAGRKKSGQLQALIVTGCLSQRYKDEIIKEIPEVDALLGTASVDEIANALDRCFDGEKANYYKPLDEALYESDERVNSSGMYYAYLKIAEGCDKRCTYCIIPSLRGPYRSYPLEYLEKEARKLVAGGVNELILVAQETTRYGIDLYGKKSLPKLLRTLSEIEELKWIRILYCYPEEIDDELIEEIAVNPKVCHYLDMPIQHASDDILKAMGRGTTSSEIETIIGKLRERIPDIALRTTLISGFPGEKRSDAKKLLSFIERIRFDRLGVFTYSREEDTPAASFPNQVGRHRAKLRRDRLMKLQQRIVRETSEELIGKAVEVCIEGSIPEEGVYVGRTYRDAPDVDGYIFMESDRSLMSGDHVTARITGVKDYDLIGEITDEPA